MAHRRQREPVDVVRALQLTWAVAHAFELHWCGLTGPRTKALVEYLEVRGYADAARSLAELIARAVTNNLQRLMLPALAGPAPPVPIASLVQDGLSHGALRSAAARGALRAQQDALGQWQSSQVFVDQYLAQRNSRRGRPKGT